MPTGGRILPNGGLPFTGGSEWPQAVFALLCVGLGGGLWIASRRRNADRV
jgi:LPXTG-motif cell wall-anchored protein